MATPCRQCESYWEEQVDQFGYRLHCAELVPESVFMSEHGCWKYRQKATGEARCPRCGGRLARHRYDSVREQYYRHCFSCNLEFYEEGEDK